MNRLRLSPIIYVVSLLIVDFASGEVLTVAKPLKEVVAVKKISKSVILVARPLVEPVERKVDSATDPVHAKPTGAVPSPQKESADTSPQPFSHATSQQRQTPQVEKINSRYRSGAIATTEEVIINHQGDYENHGLFKKWDTEGHLVAAGHYEHGRPSGDWKRIYRGEIASKLLIPEQGHFDLPLTSTFRFKDAVLDGEWRIVDSANRPVRTWNFRDGKLHGQIVVYFSSGGRMRDAHYDQGVPIATHHEWTDTGKLTQSHTFEHGRLRAETEYRWANGALKAKGVLLHPRYRLTTVVDWWNGGLHIQSSDPIGEPLKLGEWKYFYPDGRFSETGNYVRGLREGEFTWWYPSGQLRVRGNFYSDQPHGSWTWWHANGAKQTAGQYTAGQQTGRWIDWNERGAQTGLVEHAIPSHKNESTVQPPQSRPPRGIRRDRTEIPLTAERDTHRDGPVRPAEQLR